MSLELTLSLIVLIIVIDIVLFTRFKDYFTYEITEYVWLDENGKTIKRG